MNPTNLWAIGIIGILYVMNTSKLFYFAGGIFVGVNYHAHLKPYTDIAQNTAVKKLTELEKSQNIKIPGIDYLKPENVPDPSSSIITPTRFEAIKKYIKG